MSSHIADLKTSFLKRGYQKATIIFQFNHLNNCKENNPSLLLTYNQTLPNFREIVNKVWSLLKIKKKLKQIFEKKQHNSMSPI